MESSGLPNPTGVAERRSSVQQQLSSQGLTPVTPQTRYISFATPGAEYMTEQQPLQAAQFPSAGQPGPSWVSNHQELRNQLAKLDEQNMHQNNFELPYHEPVMNAFAQMIANGPPKSLHSSMAFAPHLNFSPQVEMQNPFTQISVEELRRCSERLKQYMLQQRKRPKDDNIQFWRKFVAEFFAPGAKKRWCISLYKNCNKREWLFSKVAWQCDLCNEKPHRGFEISEELLPRLHKMKYSIGVLEEFLQLEQPSVHRGAFGQIILHYAKAREESEYDQVRIVRHGQLRICFSPDYKINSWEFCAQHHKEYIPRMSVIPQVCHLRAALHNHKHSSEDSSSATPEELQKNTDSLVSSAAEMIQALRMPFVSNLGIVKRYQRGIQMAEVIDMMKDLMDYSHKNGCGPKESLIMFPRANAQSAYNPTEHEAAIHFPNFPIVVNGSAQYNNGFGNCAAPHFMEPAFKRQCVGPHSYGMQNTSPNLQYSPVFAGQLNFAHAFPTPTPTPFPNFQHSNFGDGSDPQSNVDRIIQEVLAAHKPADETMPIGDGQFAGPSRIGFRNNGGASTSGASTNGPDYRRLSRHAKGKQPAVGFDDVRGELMEFDELQELLNHML